jgi:hypothetical protein
MPQFVFGFRSIAMMISGLTGFTRSLECLPLCRSVLQQSMNASVTREKDDSAIWDQLLNLLRYLKLCLHPDLVGYITVTISPLSNNQSIFACIGERASVQQWGPLSLCR